MDTSKYPLSFHLKEFKTRLIYVLVWYVIFVGIIYFFSDRIYQFIARPLILISSQQKMIYTSLTEVFFSYLKLSTTLAFMLIIPLITFNLYKFIAPGLYERERRLTKIILFLAPLLYWLGVVFCYYVVIPKAWEFFLAFENQGSLIPIILEAKVSEYLQLIIDMTFAFGLAFQLPVVLLILTILGVVTPRTLENNRRFAVVIIFIIGGVLTPPDIFSQFALAIPMLLLYEISIKFCKIVEK